jgi:hypothetical protein
MVVNVKAPTVCYRCNDKMYISKRALQERGNYQDVVSAQAEMAWKLMLRSGSVPIRRKPAPATTASLNETERYGG